MVAITTPAPQSRIRQFLVRSEAWLPLAIGFAWWMAMYPGLYGNDSLMNLASARHGPVTVWFTAWWIYFIRFVTIGTRAIPLLTLFGVLALTSAVRYWAAAFLPRGPARVAAVCLVCATPLVGALGIQVLHDVEMTAGLLLCAAVVDRLGRERRAAARPKTDVVRDVALLAIAVVLIATRHNGLAVLVGGALGCLIVPAAGFVRQGIWFLVTASAVLVLMFAATRVSGHRGIVDPLGSVEWAFTDISCVLTKPGVGVSEENWRYLTTVASRSDWPQPTSCRFMAKELFRTPTFKPSVIRQDPGALLRAWRALAADNPRLMLAAHAERVRQFLPPFVTGWPRTDNLPFIHSTILPNGLGLRWKWPRVAETVRLAARAWNAMALVFGNAAIWLAALIVSVRMLGERGRRLYPTVALAIALELGILIAAPMSEARYGLFILITGQTAALTLLFQRVFPA